MADREHARKKKMRASYLTTSWDDGHRDDIRLARMLKAYGLKGTFYVSPEDQEFARQDLLTAHEIKNISLDFEIGAHTLTHARLPAIPEGQAEEEIFGSKTVLEEITGKKVETFCYPYGSYAKAHVQLVKNAGYRYARTVTRYKFDLDDPYEAGTSVHAYNHGWYDMWRIAHFAKFQPVRALQYAEWDAEQRFHVPGIRVTDPKAAQCGEVLKGVLKPAQCKLFGRECTPENPVGALMVSSEGSCAAYFNYEHRKNALVTSLNAPA